MTTFQTWTEVVPKQKIGKEKHVIDGNIDQVKQLGLTSLEDLFVA